MILWREKKSELSFRPKIWAVKNQIWLKPLINSAVCAAVLRPQVLRYKLLG